MANSGVTRFVVHTDYTPDGEGRIALRKNDLCVVTGAVLDKQGWLVGENKTSGEIGEFPGTYCNHVSVPPRPPRSTKPGSMRSPEKRTHILVNGHNVRTISTTKAVWCCCCEDFIWGKNRVSYVCKECNLIVHSECWRYFHRSECRSDPSIAPLDFNDLTKEIHEWSVAEVLEWLAALRYHEYLHLFKDACVTGEGLMSLEDGDIKELGIPFYIHIKMIGHCLQESFHNSNSLNGPQDLFHVFKDQEIDFHPNHSYKDHTFTSVQFCDVCKKRMFGVLKQGLMCKVCGLQCHRYCAQSASAECEGQYQRGRRVSDAEEPAFGVDPTEGVRLPVVVTKCVEALKKRGEQQKDCYAIHPDFNGFHMLRAALNQEAASVQFKADDYGDCACIAAVLRMFLLEMTEPVIQFSLYDNFIIAAKLTSCDADTQQLLRQKSELSSYNETLFDYIMNHLVRVLRCDTIGTLRLEKIAKMFSTVLLRPHFKENRLLVQNLDHHYTIIKVFLEDYLRTPTSPAPSVIPPKRRTVSRASSNSKGGTSSLNGAPWYWGNITRETASEELRDTLDGTFLVRDSSTSGEYTLTLRKGGSNKLIKIYHKDGMYGFSTDYVKFNSVVALVDYFRTHSLKEYNPKLDITLGNPLSQRKSDVFNEEDLESLKERFQTVNGKLGQFNALQNQLIASSEELEEARGLVDAQTEVIALLEEQLKLTGGYVKEKGPQVQAILEESEKRLKESLELEKHNLETLDSHFEQISDHVAWLEKELNLMRPEIPDLERSYDQIERKMKEKNPHGHRVENLDETDNDERIYDVLRTKPLPLPEDRGNKLPEWSWRMTKKVTKREVHGLLDGKPDGTFLMRNSEKNPSIFVISLVHDNAIKHITIERGPDGYGFAEPYNKYKTLQDLINHYHKQSLRIHNPQLDTTLTFPVQYFDDEEEENVYM